MACIDENCSRLEYDTKVKVKITNSSGNCNGIPVEDYAKQDAKDHVDHELPDEEKKCPECCECHWPTEEPLWSEWGPWHDGGSRHITINDCDVDYTYEYRTRTRKWEGHCAKYKVSISIGINFDVESGQISVSGPVKVAKDQISKIQEILQKSKA